MLTAIALTATAALITAAQKIEFSETIQLHGPANTTEADEYDIIARFAN